MGAPLIAHVVHRFAIGGLENGLVNLINHLPPERYRHALVCITESTAFSRRLRREEVEVVELHKRPGKDIAIYPRLWRCFRRLRPSLVHTRNLAALDAVLPAAAAGVPHRVHGEHGRDIYDLDGSNPRYRRLRRLLRPWIHAWVPMSKDLARWLQRDVGVPRAQIHQIYSGVDCRTFRPPAPGPRSFPRAEFVAPGRFLVLAVGRLEPVKDPLTLLRAFLDARARSAASRAALRLAYLGDGALFGEMRSLVQAADAEDAVWLAGARDDVPTLLRAGDLFVLPSLGEGVSNTVLEAMASGLAVLATDVGGNPELVTAECGRLVEAQDHRSMADAIEACWRDPQRTRALGRAGRERVLREFALDVMVRRYRTFYDQILGLGHL